MISSRESFYVTGGTIPGDASCYVERTADQELLQGIRSGQYIYVLDSRQMGKSSLCIRTLRKLNDLGVRTAFVDLTKFGVRNVTVEQWFVAMLREVGRALNLTTQLTNYWRENADIAPVQRFFGAIQDTALAEIPGQLAIFIDEIDVTRSLPFDTDEFFAGIRQCYIGRATDPKLSRLTFSLFGTATPAELIEDTRVSPFNIGHRVDLKDFGFTESLVLAQNIPGDSEAVLKRILYWTGGHPYLTQRLCQLVAQSGGAVSVDEACDSLFLDRRAKENDDNLAFVRNRLLNNELDIGALLELYGKVRAGKPVRDDETNPMCAVLRMSGATRVENGLLRVRNRIYSQVFDQAWIQQHLPDAESRRQRAAYRRGLIRATAIAGGAVLVVAALAVYGFSEALAARDALANSKRLTERLTQSKRDLQQSLDTAKDLAGTLSASKGKLQESLSTSKTAQNAAREAALQATLQKNYANLEAGRAVSATRLATSRLSDSYVSNAMQRLDMGDPASALDPLLAALKLDQHDPYRSRILRTRLSYALHAASNLRQVWSGAGQMFDAEFLPGTSTVMTANLDGFVRFWDANSGAAAMHALYHPGVTAVALSRDGRHLLTGSSRGDVRWWDVRLGKLLLTIPIREPITKVAFADGDKRFAVATKKADGFENVRVATLPSGQPLPDHPIGFSAKWPGITSIVFSPSGKRIVVTSSMFMAYSCDLGDGLGDKSISSCFNAQRAQFIGGGRQILINGAGEGFDAGVVQLCRLTGEPIAKYKAERVQDGKGAAFCLSPNGELLLSATTTGTLQMYDLRTGRTKGPAIRVPTELTDCSVSPDGRFVCAASTDGAIRTWSAASGEPIGSFLWHGAVVSKVSFDASSTRILSCSKDGTARLWQIAVPGIAQTTVGPTTYEGRPWFGWINDESLLSTSRNAIYRWDRGHNWTTILPGWMAAQCNHWIGPLDRIIVAKGDAIRVYDFKRGQFITPPLRTVTGFHRTDSGFFLGSDKRYLFDEYAPRRLRAYDLDHGARQLWDIPLPYRLVIFYPSDQQMDLRDRNVGLVPMAETDRFATCGTHDEVDIWELHSGTHVASMSSVGGLADVGSHRNGSILTAEHGPYPASTVVVVRPADGKVLAKGIPFLGAHMPPILSSDGSRLLAPDGTSLWDTQSWRRLLIYKPSGSVTNMSEGLGVDSKRDRVFIPFTRRVFSLATGQALTPLLTDAPAESSYFSPNGRYIAVATRLYVQVFDLIEHRMTIERLFTGSVTNVGFTPDSRLLYTNTAYRLKFWDPPTGEEVIPAVISDGPWDELPAFSPSGTYFACAAAGHVVVNTLSDERKSVEELAKETRAVSQASIKRLDAKSWAALKDHYADLVTSNDTAAMSTPVATSWAAENYSYEDAIRDMGMEAADVRGLIDAAQAAARAEQWDSARQSIDRAVESGARGTGVQMLQGLIALRAKRYSDAVAALSHLSIPQPSRLLTFALFQALAGNHDYMGAARMLREPDRVLSLSTGLYYEAFADLVLGVGGDVGTARASYIELMKCRSKPEYADPLAVAGPILASVSGALDPNPELHEYFAKSLADWQDSSTLWAAAYALELARTGKMKQSEAQMRQSVSDTPEPDLALARALIDRHESSEAKYRAGLRACEALCRSVVSDNDCRTVDSTLRVLRASLIGREVKQRLGE